MSEKNRLAELEENEMQVEIAVKYGKGIIQQRMRVPNIWDNDTNLKNRFEVLYQLVLETKDKIDKGEIIIE
ncbi:hypothetical protein LCGC14_0547530 [marine sediment metagenome]|uniref:Uncharacterized protein n=1 Tax=marine sediment metagenome TaxID=412755 RepID=A0A0F9UC78_9ZZZZ